MVVETSRGLVKDKFGVYDEKLLGEKNPEILQILYKFSLNLMPTRLLVKHPQKISIYFTNFFLS